MVGGPLHHAYDLGGPATPAKTLCGRRAFAGTSRGNVWHDHGPAALADALARVSCPECRARIGA